MNHLNVIEFFLTGIVTYGPFMFALALFLAGLGIPLPGSLLVLATGAFVQQEVIGAPAAVIFGLSGVVLGDSVCYSIGYLAKKWSQHHFAHTETWQKAEETFHEQGWLAIYLTRFILTPLALPTNLIAGGSAYPFSRFLLIDTLGELTWLLLYGGLGYAFSSQWQLIGQLASDFSGLLVALFLLAICIYLLMPRDK